MAALPNPVFSPAPEEWPEELVNLGPETDPETDVDADIDTESSARRPEQAAAAEPRHDSSLNWLFVDLNSYFASCEQEARPELRGRPIGVVPMMADTTCCIAA